MRLGEITGFERVQKEGRTHPDNYNFKVGSGNGGNNEIIELQLSPVLKQSRIVTSFVLYASKKTIELLLNHKYESKTVIFPVDIDKASFNWTKFTEDFETKLKNKGIGQEHITMLADSLDENWKKISDLLHKNNEDSDDSSDEGKSAAQIALDLAEEHCSELFVDQFGTQYGALKIGEHVETLRLKDSRFKSWLFRTYYLSEDKILNAESVTNVLNILTAKAEFEGAIRTLDLRVTNVQDEPFTIYYDLSNKDWQVVKITPEGWSIEPSPIIFRRYKSQQPQVYPSKGILLLQK